MNLKLGGNVELLSPAGDMAAFKAAVACGADAVYLGYTAFGARSYAGNFGREELIQAVDYAHERGRKVYVTVNTLIKDREMTDLYDTLDAVRQSRADAIIVQDIGIVPVVRDRYPELTLHASTQMTVHNVQGVRLLSDMGFPRVVAARECSLEEIRRMAATGTEIEVFAHGSLCVSVSGQCLFSSMIGGRSGNRGKCAQPCRMRYTLNSGKEGYLLSPRDLMLIRRLAELKEAGVSSIKLEGRMKRPEYVGVVTRAYRTALDAIEREGSFKEDEALIDGLKQIYNRGDFTEGYLAGKNHAALMSWEKQNHKGVSVGTVVRVVDRNTAVLQAERDLHKGDSLQIRNQTETDFVFSQEDIPAGGRIQFRLPPACRVSAGQKVYRITDTAQLAEINSVIRNGAARTPVSGKLFARLGEPVRFELWDGQGNCVSVSGRSPAMAESRPLSEKTAFDQLSKMGDTPFAMKSFTFDGEDGCFLPMGELNALRRQATEALSAQRKNALRPAHSLALPQAQPLDAGRELIVSSPLLSDSLLLKEGADRFIWQPNTIIVSELEEMLEHHPELPAIGIELPAVTYTQELESLLEFVARHTDFIRCVVVNSIGQLGVDWPCAVWGGQGLNLFNRESARVYSGFKVRRQTLSCELSLREMKELSGGQGGYIVSVYGRAQLMLLSHCPYRTQKGDTKGDNACARCRPERNDRCECYTDTKGYRFPAYGVRTPHGCLIRLYNSVPLDAARFEKELKATGCSLRLSFTDEHAEKKTELVRTYRNWIDKGEPLRLPADDTTGGRRTKGVE